MIIILIITILILIIIIITTTITTITTINTTTTTTTTTTITTGPLHQRSFELPLQSNQSIVHITHIEGLLRVMDLSQGKQKMALKHRKNHPIRNFHIPYGNSSNSNKSTN